MALESPTTPENGPSRLRRALTRRCVRCGEKPRAEALYLCDTCYADPCWRREARQASARFAIGVDQRRWLVAELGWKGGWGRGS